MRSFIIGLIAGIVVVVAGVYIYFAMGWAPVATADAEMPFEMTLAHMAMHARIARDMRSQQAPPLPADEPNLTAGAHVYRDHCAACHGLNGQPKPEIAGGEAPAPPQFFHGEGVTDDPPGETYWKARNGIRLTGMPAFGKSLNDRQLWQVSLLLAHADKLPSSVQKLLAEPAPGH